MNSLVKKYGKRKQWVNWKLVKSKDRFTKIPYSISGRKASSTDESTWSTYTEAKKHSDNVGIIFTPEKTLLGIDIDHCLKDLNIDHELKQEIALLIIEADTYTEVSPSGEGLHLFLEITEPFDLISNRKKGLPYELYTAGRFFTFTANPYKEERPVRKVTLAEVKEILSIINYPWTDDSTPTESTPATSNGVLTDDLIIKKMFGSKNGHSIKALYDGDLTSYDGDHSSADMALCSTLAFWTGKNPEQMERIWLSSALSNRKKTKERKDYRDRTIKNAISNCKEVYETFTDKIKKSAPNLDLITVSNKNGDQVVVQNTENICRVLSDHPDFSGRLRYDAFRNVFEFKNNKDKWRLIEDNDSVIIQTQISVTLPVFAKVGKTMVQDAIIKVAKDNTYDSGIDYLSNLVWDGKPRLDTWLVSVYGTPDDKYHRAVGSNWLKGLVKRIISPGSKFDYVLVLEGEQGTKKSTSLYILGGDWHVETTMSTDSKDFFMQFCGKAIIEFSEGETLSRTEVKRMKAIITMQTDKYRPPYERTSQDFPRRCVFAMTTNQTEYLKDETGNRRWLPVTVMLPESNIEWLKENRDQLFAEAYHRVHDLNETTYEFPKEETLQAQNSRRIQDANTDLIANWYFNDLSHTGRMAGITIYQVYRDVLCGGFTTKPLDKYNEMMIADTLKNQLRLFKRRVQIDNIQSNRWYCDDELMESLKGDETKEFWKTFDKK